MTWLAVFLVLAPSMMQAADIVGAPQVVVGAATFQQNGNVRTIEQQTGAAVINWQGFDIKAGDITRFIQPGVDSATLNRVLGGNPSLILGQLQANGQVYLINPNGIVVGPQGRIDVGAFFASTLNISDNDFLKQGNLLFSGDSKAGIHNLGTINAQNGDVMLIAYTVKNAGEINAPKGVAGLAAGSEVLLTHQGDQRILVKSGLQADGLEQGVENSGLMKAAQAELKAAGGSIYELAVNQSGIIRATGVEEKNGRVLLTADGGKVKVSGEISAHNANGSGGEILVGGDYQGKNSAVANAATTIVTESAKLDVSANATMGNGGKAIVWADGATQFKGTILAKGGSEGGDGGLLEVSGKRVLDFSGTADTSAPFGKKGRLLLDPDSIIITTDAGQDIFNQGGYFQAGAIPSYLNVSTLNSTLGFTDVEIYTSGPAGYNGISVNADVNWTTASGLTLASGDTIAINANISGGTGSSLNLYAGVPSLANSSVGTISLAANKSISVGSLTLGKSMIAAPDNLNVGTVNLAGTVNAGSVFLSREFGGFAADVLINNVNNTIGALETIGNEGTIGGNLKVYDSAGGLMVNGDFSGVAGAVEIVTGGNLTLGSGALVKNTGASDLVLAARGGSFVNNSGATAVEASGSGRYLIYSDAPVNTIKGGLTGATTYNKTYDANAPATISATGDRFLYSLAPVLTFTAESKSKTYGAANPALTYSVSGLLSGDTLGAAITGTPALSTSATAGTSSGTAPISTANGTLSLTDMGYGIALVSSTLTIDQAPLTITPVNTSKTYGAANPTFSAGYSGLVNGDLSTVVSGLLMGTPATASSGVGTYAITGSGASAANYSISYLPGTLTINQAPLTITANNNNKIYGSANPTFSASFGGLVNGDLSTVVSGLALGTTATASSGAGTYPITGSGASAANYSISYSPGVLTIDRALLTITANDASRAFGAANPTFSALYGGLVNGDNSSVVSGLSLATTADAASPVGNYSIIAAGASAANYSISYVPGTLSVANAILTITADNFSRIYGSANPTFTAGYAGFINGDTVSIVSGLQFNTSATINSGIGTYSITPFGASAPNYGINYVAGSLSISPADLVIRANNASRIYGAVDPTFTANYSGLVAGDTAANISGLTLTPAATVTSGVGDYAITASGAANPNYNISYAPGTLTIDKAPLTIAADNKSKTYGAVNPALTATFTGLKNGENDSVVSGLSLATTAATGSGAGNYAITASGASAANYSISYGAGTLTIGKAPLIITANDASRTYGAVNPSFSASYNGLVNSDLSSVVSGLLLGTTATSSTGVGGYPITASGASAVNYNISYAPGTLTINQAPLTITANSLNKTYGSANPTLTASYSGLMNGESSGVVSGLSLGTTATSSTGVGGYAITASGASAANYSISYAPGTLTIDKAPLAITADNQSKIYGSANPTLTASYSGLVNNDLSSVVSGLSIVTAATANSGVGDYGITVSGASAPNYSISYTAGTLSVNPATLTVRADNQTRFYGDANPTFGGTVSGFVLGENTSVLTSLPTYSTTAGLTTGVGGYAITPSGGSAANYNIVRQNGTLTINPAILAVNADNTVRTYGDANPTLTYTVSGLKNGDSADGKFFIFTHGSVAAPNSPVGNYNIIFNGNDTPNDNYSTFFANGTLTVQPRALTIRTDAISREYGLANPAFTATFTGLASFDTPSVIPTLGFNTLATTASGVGDYTVTPTSGNNANYVITRLPSLMSITPAPLTIAAGSLFRDYGDANPTFTPFIAGGSLRNGDTAVGVNLRIVTGATQSSPVGTYNLAGAITSPNYTIVNSVAGSLQILPAILNVTVGNGTRLYGDANPGVSVSATGLKLSDTAAAQVTLTHSATAQAPVGTYSISAVGNSANYQINSVTPGNLQIFPAPLNVTVGNTSRGYGDANPTTAPLTVTGFKFGEAGNTAVQIIHSATLQSSVGSYPITATGINPNYFLSAVTPGALQITPAQLNVRLFNADRIYGDANPTPAFETITGLKFGETFASVVSRGNSATLQSGVGSYPFTATSISPNYQVNSVEGSLRILPAPLNVTAANTTRFYGDPNPATALQSVVGLKFGETPASIVTLNSEASLQQLVGTYDILATSQSPNYQITLVSGTMRVNPRPITLIGNDASKIFGENNPSLSYSVGGSGVASFDNAATLLAGVGVSTTAELTSTVGGYPIAITGPTVPNPNYAVTLQPGTLTVNPRPISLDVQGFTRFYYDANPEVVTTIGGMGLASFDTLADVISWIDKTPALAADIGAYPLFPRILDSHNYDITLRGNLATIVPRNLTIYVDSIKVDEGATVPGFSAVVGNLPTGLTMADVLPNLTYGTVDDAASFRPEVRPVSALTDHPIANPFAAANLSAMEVDADGNILKAPNTAGGLSGLATKFLIFAKDPAPVPPVVLDPDTTFLIPVDFVTGGTLVSRKTITVSGYNENPNYAVTYVSGGRLEVIIPNAATLAAREMEAIAESKAHLEVTTTPPATPFKMPEAFKAPAMQPYLEQAAQTLMAQLISAGDTVTLDLYFKDGISSFLSGFNDDPTRQTMLMGRLSEVVIKYAKLPADQQPPELAFIIQEATIKAKQVKIDQAQEVVRLYDEWLAGPDPSIPQIVNPGDMNLVPNFAHQVKVSYAKDAAIVIGTSLGAGATVGALMCAVPVSAITSAVATGGALSGASLGFTASTTIGAAITATTTSGAGAVSGIGMAVVAPALVAALAVATITIAAVQLAKQPEIKASIAAAQSLAVAAPAGVSLDLNDVDDQAAFTSGFLSFMSGGAL